MNDRKIRLFMVEDEAIVAAGIRVSLEDLGYEVLGVAGTSHEAISMLEKERPDIIFMDISIRGGRDGIETAKEVRERWGTPVVFLTAYSDAATLDRAREAEPYGYLLKPFDERSLRPVVEMALHKHKMELERKELTEKLQAALNEVAQLRGLLPVCAWCKKVRDDDGYWETLEEYLSRHLETTYSHGICPSCQDQVMENILERK
ncbi:MAG: response regulator [Gemmatimonadota bacterium]|nr:response regulator [Gemmatimonadota bacterium]MDH5760458.1 response regulator [Gemmatimonadota bacterium]